MEGDSVVFLRMLERFVMTGVVIVVAVVVMVGFWKSIQKIDLKASPQVFGFAGSFVLSTPVFVLVALIAYAAISLQNPIAFSRKTGQTVPVSDEEHASVSTNEETDFLGVTNLSREVPTDAEFARSEATRQIETLNCIARSRTTTSRLEDDTIAIKLALLAPVWDARWGSFEAFSEGVRGFGSDPPDVEALAVFEREYDLCEF